MLTPQEHLKKYLDYIIGECGKDIIIKNNGNGSISNGKNNNQGNNYDGENIPIEILNEYDQDIQVGYEDDFIDYVMSAVGEAEENSRQYSPFEFTAKDFNESKNPDSVWEAYDEGIVKGAKAAIKEKLSKLEKVTMYVK